jgi:hypothetical protein
VQGPDESWTTSHGEKEETGDFKGLERLMSGIFSPRAARGLEQHIVK